MSRILITGGTGFLGRHCAKRFQEKGNEVSVLGRNPTAGAALERAGIRFIRADLADVEKMNEACRDQHVVIHTAALASPFGNFADFYRANVVGTQNLVRAALKAQVRRIVNISTPSLYFNYQHREKIRESESLPAKQVTHYGATKLQADRIIEGAGKMGIEVIAIRPRAIFGEGDQNILPRVIRTAESGRFPLINGGHSLIDLSYIDNVVDAVELCVQAPLTALGRTYNITNGEPISVRNMVERLYTALEKPVKFRHVPYSLAFSAAAASEGFYKVLRPGKEPALTRYGVGLMTYSQTLDISKAKKELGYDPKVSLDEGFRRFSCWWATQ